MSCSRSCCPVEVSNVLMPSSRRSSSLSIPREGSLLLALPFLLPLRNPFRNCIVLLSPPPSLLFTQLRFARLPLYVTFYYNTATTSGAQIERRRSRRASCIRNFALRRIRYRHHVVPTRTSTRHSLGVFRVPVLDGEDSNEAINRTIDMFYSL